MEAPMIDYSEWSTTSLLSWVFLYTGKPSMQTEENYLIYKKMMSILDARLNMEENIDKNI